MSHLGFERIFLPPNSPKLNPPERVFEAIRRPIEDKGYYQPTGD